MALTCVAACGGPVLVDEFPGGEVAADGGGVDAGVEVDGGVDAVEDADLTEAGDAISDASDASEQIADSSPYAYVDPDGSFGYKLSDYGILVQIDGTMRFFSYDALGSNAGNHKIVAKDGAESFEFELYCAESCFLNYTYNTASQQFRSLYNNKPGGPVFGVKAPGGNRFRTTDSRYLEMELEDGGVERRLMVGLEAYWP